LKKNFTKANLYWPQNQGDRLIFGPFSITLYRFTETRGIVIRRFQVENLLEEPCSRRFVTQLHYVDWPDHGCPKNTDAIRTLINIKKYFQDQSQLIKQGPIVVHCSAGIGRAGTFIAIDILIRKFSKGKLDLLSLNVMETVKRLRLQRRGMIQTFDQYQFIYTVIQELIQKRRLKFPLSQQNPLQGLHDHLLCSRLISVCEQ